MINLNNISLIIYDSPISRAYMQILLEQNIVLDEVFYLNSKKNFFISNYITSYMNYKKNNFFPLQFINDDNNKDFIFKIENYFSIKKNFINEMFSFDLIYKISKKVNFIGNDSINSKEILSQLKNKKLILFNTGKELIKNEILSEFDLIHIHPGYLPEFRGADNSLHMILNNNSLGVSSFFVNKGIDTGKIITRKKWLFKSFDFELQDSFTLKEKYMFWYSFVDPLLRAIEFKEIINLKHYEKSTLNDIQLENEVSNYYSFMTDDDLKLVFKKIF
jgi:hypothetical protein